MVEGSSGEFAPSGSFPRSFSRQGLFIAMGFTFLADSSTLANRWPFLTGRAPLARQDIWDGDNPNVVII